MFVWQPVFFSTRACMSLIKPDQTMSYRACKTRNKKVTENEEGCSLRYILATKFSDVSGGAWFSVFNDEAEKIIGCSADELDKMSQLEILRSSNLCCWGRFMTLIACKNRGHLVAKTEDECIRLALQTSEYI